MEPAMSVMVKKVLKWEGMSIMQTRVAAPVMRRIRSMIRVCTLS